MTAERSARVAAVDLGASSGRVMVAEVDTRRIELEEVHRFPNVPVRLGATLHWDVLAIYRGLLDGLRAAGDRELHAVGIDSWGVDYGLLDASGALLGNPVHYRDARTGGATEALHARVPAAELYGVSGLQVLPFTTIYQLEASAGDPQRALAERLLMIPDLMAYWLTGARTGEVTNASTTGLVDAARRDWSTDLATRVGVDPAMLPPLVEPGTRIGELVPSVLADIGLDGPLPVVAVGSHDTASAIVGVPASSERFAYVATGTWSLVGVELTEPALSEAGRSANFSHELGVDRTVRYLRNVMGLWLLQECLRAWGDPELEPLLAAAAAEPGLRSVIDASDPTFIPPDDMPARITAACRARGMPEPASRAALVRCILDSLALAHRRAVRDAVQLSGREVDLVHVVGGGARSPLLCRLTAEACGVPVEAGPVEAAAYGNALVAARAIGAVEGGINSLRAVLRASVRPVRYDPEGTLDWDAAEALLS